MYRFDYVVSREDDHPVQARTSFAPRLESAVASAKSQLFGSVKLMRSDAIGFIVKDGSGSVVRRWYEGDEL
jgi:hypothetical protein